MLDQVTINNAIRTHRAEFIRDLGQLIEVPSIRGTAAPHAPFGVEPRRVLEVVVDIATAYGFKAAVVNDAVAYAQWGDDDDHYVGIVGHLDVVAAGKGWTSDPFILNERHDRFYARGILDNKGPIMACLFGMKLLKDLGYQPERTIRIIFGSDEESGSSDIPLYLQQEPAPEFGFTPDGKFPAVYGERGIVNYLIETPLAPASLAQISQIKGDQARDHVPADLSTTINGHLLVSKGKQAPTNAPEMGINAITKMAQQIVAQRSLDVDLGNYFQWIVTSLHEQHYGEGLRIDFADQDSGKLIVTPYALQKTATGMQLALAIRYPVTYSENDVTEGLKQAVIPGSKITVTRRILGTMHDKNDWFIQQLSQVYAAITGLDGTPVTTTGATYARSMPNIIAFGPSFPGQKGIAHKQDEWMDEKDLMLNMSIYMNAMLRLTTRE